MLVVPHKLGATSSGGTSEINCLSSRDNARAMVDLASASKRGVLPTTNSLFQKPYFDFDRDTRLRRQPQADKVRDIRDSSYRNEDLTAANLEFPPVLDPHREGKDFFAKDQLVEKLC